MLQRKAMLSLMLVTLATIGLAIALAVLAIPLGFFIVVAAMFGLVFPKSVGGRIIGYYQLIQVRFTKRMVRNMVSRSVR